ncbi:MAG: SUF system NifU family Fe-S cluster assembly protein [Dehalococcoidia bacterium]|nr:SUF system NifU family Fe-S cluster assembly protein [Dehalococcoidia bacterium]
MSDLSELYQEVIMDHNRRPRNFKPLVGASCSLEGFNPLCGDRIILDLKLEGDTIADIGFQGSGCAISKASASLMTDSIKGKNVEAADEMFEAFRDMLTKGDAAHVDADKLGDLEVLAGVAQFPTRIKCAILAWHTLHAALHGRREAISAE